MATSSIADKEFIGVIFSAQYCPPCHGFVEPLAAFYQEAKKDARFEFILVNCDKGEQEYNETLKSMPWVSAVPYLSEEVIEKLEDASDASYLPKVAVFSVAKGFERPVVYDIK